MGNTSRAPDVGQLREADLGRFDFPASGREEFRVYFSEAVHSQIGQHAAEDTSREICGILVGRWGRDGGGPFVVISELIRCDSATSGKEHVTFTHDTWAEVSRQMDTRFADLSIVGWYHSHPDFGVFLSQRDCFIHEHFFNNPGQVAYVVDPVQNAEGVFVWNDGKLALWPHFWVGQRIYSRYAIQQQTPPTEEKTSGDAAERPPGEQPPLLPYLVRALGYLAALVIGYLLARVPSAWEQQRMLEGTVAHFAAWKVIRAGLDDYVAQIDGNLAAAAAAVRRLGPEHTELQDKNGDQRWAEYRELERKILAARQLLGVVKRQYCFSDLEQAALAKLISDTLTGRAAVPPPSGGEKPAGQEPGPAAAPGPPEEPPSQPEMKGK